jgi:hypothetical protein
VLVVPSASFAETTIVKTSPVKQQAKKDPRLRKQALLIAEAQVALWKCQDQRRVPRTAASTSPWALPQSHAYRQWAHKLWVKRQKGCLVELHRWDDVIRQLQRGLSGTPMDGSAGDLLAAGLRYRISPFFIAGIAGTESSFGAAACSNNRYNAFGLASCGSSWRVPNFQSWREAYFFMGQFLTSRWAGASTTFHYHGYAACSSCWGAKTAMHMRFRFGVGSSVRF